MAGVSRRGIYYDLRLSEYVKTIEYENNTIQYSFSSQLYFNKFNSMIEQNRSEFKKRFTGKYKIYINTDILADLYLYQTIEKRGFYLTIDSEVVRCQDNLKLDGLKLQTRS